MIYAALSSGITATETFASEKAEINGEKAAVDFIKEEILSNEVDFFAALSRQDFKTFSLMKQSTKIKVYGKEKKYLKLTEIFLQK